MKKKIYLVLALGLLIASLSGCAVKKNQVAYTVYPVGYLANRIIGDKLQVVSIQNDEIVQRATLVDDYENQLELSQNLFHIGTLEPYLTVNSEQIKKTKVGTNDLSVLNAIYKFQRYTPVNVDGTTTYIESSYYKGETFETIDSYEKDLYLWMDPIAMLSMAKDITKWLSTNYEEDSKYFNENLVNLEKDLVQLDAEYQKLATKLANEGKEIKFVSMTPSFGNWQKAYGFQVYPVVLSKFGALPTDEQLQVIKNRILADNVQYIVYEPNLPEDMIALLEQLETELGLKRVTMNNLSSLTTTQKEENKDYVSIMYENLSSLESMATTIPVVTSTKVTEQLDEKTVESGNPHDDIATN
ncbi:metal ABC transporter substrate-binding protein [Anaerorhabdus furcosa]|uniref:ABC-type Zn uptake system ZnuABC, Zn-binding component ZnuA n=1 Tax=Anaerorhabdus furcosa TaxID=118967 RepID=A0A1T4P2T1_9FIRM|nr:zinc ABC transporter substrate-binding protein [Anaerorhabdus furcosa]SJZ85910.1 ABC-type Zn uptake system ZnuABC, Zn-binding component ZnuA [Anaerorhabdus furcosa]